LHLPSAGPAVLCRSCWCLRHTSPAQPAGDDNTCENSVSKAADQAAVDCAVTVATHSLFGVDHVLHALLSAFVEWVMTQQKQKEVLWKQGWHKTKSGSKLIHKSCIAFVQQYVQQVYELSTVINHYT